MAGEMVAVEGEQRAPGMVQTLASLCHRRVARLEDSAVAALSVGALSDFALCCVMEQIVL